MRVRAVAGIVAGLAMVACSADYVEQSQSTILLVLTDINKGGTPILSDVRGPSGGIFNCQASIGLTTMLKNPTAPTVDTENVILQRYDVSYVRSDGRAVEGVDVPYRFSAPLTATIAPGDNITVAIDIVRHQAKIEPPLSQITGLDIVEMTANVTVYGATISRQTVSASGAAAIRFADYADGTKTCETGT